MQHWISKPKYSVGPSLEIAHVTTDDENSNDTAYGFSDDTLVNVFVGDALSKFLNTGDEYRLKNDFSSATQIQVEIEMFHFSRPILKAIFPLESDLCGLFENFALSGSPLTP